MTEAKLTLVNAKYLLPLFGPRDQHIKRIRDKFGVDITHRDGQIRIAGDSLGVSSATQVMKHLKALVEKNGSIVEDDVTKILSQVTGDVFLGASGEPISVATTGRQIKPRTQGQKVYVDAIRKHDLTFAVGPAGTGKTYLAVALAVEALRNKEIRKIVLVRPAVEAGESLGFLPGDLQAKINPYLRPLLDALHEMMDYDLIKRAMEEDIIEVVPLAYMRGRTLNDAFIILDEAQNTTVAQMKMFLTRMGSRSRIVVAGDETQVDLPPHTRSGFGDAIHRLKHLDGLAVVRLGKGDIVRHSLVQAIVNAYDEGSKRRPSAPNESSE